MKEFMLLIRNEGDGKAGFSPEQQRYYHILAKDIDEAIEIAKGNPEFAFVKGARIEVRPIKTREESLNKDYPTGK